MAIKAELLFICRPQDGWRNEKYMSAEQEKFQNDLIDHIDANPKGCEVYLAGE